MSLAPIIVFAFNRPEALKNTIYSLLQNEEVKDSDLYVFVDGARSNKAGEAEKVQAVHDIVKRITGFKSIHYAFNESNKGLANSIIQGTTRIINEYGKVIVVEDDLYVSSSFLRYMNEMLDKYEKDKRIFQVSGYGSKIKRPSDYPYDIYLNERAQSWTWGTWKDRWVTVDWEVKDYKELKSSKVKQRKFDKRGSDLFKMLKGYMEGKNNSWYIRFNYSMYKQGRYSINPIRSLVRNDGFNSEATHCNAYNRYKIDFEEIHSNDFITPSSLEPNETIMKEAVKYWSIPYRVYGKIMTIITKLKNKRLNK